MFFPFVMRVIRVLFVMRVIRVLFVAVIFVVFISGEIFKSCFFGKLHRVDRVSVGNVGLMGHGYCVVFFICLSCQQVVLCSEFEVMSCFTMGVEGLLVEFVIVFGSFVMFGHGV